MKFSKNVERIYYVNFSMDFKKFKKEYTKSESEILTEKEIKYLKIIDPYNPRTW